MQGDVEMSLSSFLLSHSCINCGTVYHVLGDKKVESNTVCHSLGGEVYKSIVSGQ